MSDPRQGRAWCSVPEEPTYSEDILKRHMLPSLWLPDSFEATVPPELGIGVVPGTKWVFGGVGPGAVF